MAQTWNGGAGDWGTNFNWTPPTAPNTSLAAATFNAMPGTSPLVSLAGGPFTIGALNLNQDVSGGFTFTGGTLQLASTGQNGPQGIHVQSHNATADFDATSRIILVPETSNSQTIIETTFPDSTLIIAGAVTDNGAGSSVTVNGPGTVVLTGTGSNFTITGSFSEGSFLTSPSIPSGNMMIRGGANLTNSFGAIEYGTMTVSGAGSMWTNRSDLLIGFETLSFGARSGALQIQDGGKVSDLNAELDVGTVVVAGAGSAWVNHGSLSIGLNVNVFPDQGLLRITNGGTVSATSTTISELGVLEIGGSFTLSGPLSINGGTVRAIADTTLPNNTTLNSGGGIFDSNGFNLAVSGTLSGPGGLTKISPGTVILSGNNSYEGSTIIKAGTLVAGSPTTGQTISQALGTGDVLLLGGTLRTPSLDPLTINVGGNYTQGPGGTLALAVGGLLGKDYDHVQVGGNASLNGTLAVNSLNNFRPSSGNAFEVLRSNGMRTGQFSQVNDSLNNNPNLQRIDVYAPNGLALVYIATRSSAGTIPSPIEAVIQNPLPQVSPDEPLLPSFLTAVGNLPSFLLAALNPTAEQLTSMFEVPFSGANTQRFNLVDRMAQIQRGATGFVSAV
ncbi:MAG: autotransporter-associated beta strand repeat-containing protein, partial [Verrucomicrobia bacterium]|nr:autotransporter-associated beta strand repeat-containing protein [Verrucomicrobiota bacterium]